MKKTLYFLLLFLVAVLFSPLYLKAQNNAGYWIYEDFSSFQVENDYLISVDTLLSHPENIKLVRYYANFAAIEKTCNDGKADGNFLRLRGKQDNGYLKFTVSDAETIRVALKAKSSKANRTAEVLINGQVVATYTGLDENNCAVFEKNVHSSVPLTVIVRGGSASSTDPICVNSIRVSKYVPLVPQVYQNKFSKKIGTFQGIDYYEGAFSGMYAIPGTHGKEFYINSDRGVNIDCKNIKTCGAIYDKLYAFPDYAPKIHRVKIDGDSVQILQTIMIKRPDGTGATGLLNPLGFGSSSADNPLMGTNCSFATKDDWGIDCEGIAVGNNNDFWLCEEGGATVWNLDFNGKVIHRYTPFANKVGAKAQDLPIDSVFGYRKNNRGFEGVAVTPNGKVYAMIQSPILYPNKAAGEASYIHRLLEIDPVSGENKMYAYLNPGPVNSITPKDWKIGDLSAVNDSTFLLIEQAASGSDISRNIYQIKINQATPVTSGLYGGKTLEQLKDSAGLALAGIIPAEKTLFLDLRANNWPDKLDKAEGLAIVNDSTIAVCNDNDYGQESVNQDGIAQSTDIKSSIYVYHLPESSKIQNYVMRQAIVEHPTITLSNKSIQFAINETDNLNASLTPSNSAYKNVIWKSRNQAVATVDNSGLVTAVSLGTTHIVATLENTDVSDSCFVTVTSLSGIGETTINYSSKVSLYPNPANTYFIVSSSSEPIQKVVLFDVAGKLVDTIRPTLDNKQVVVNTESLQMGIYLVHVYLKSGVQLQKVIVR